VKPGLSEVLFFHTVAIQQYGGAEGVRDKGALEAAIARPWMSYGGQEFFPTPYDKAAALCESIIQRNPFIEGNKRTGISAGAYLLYTFGIELEATNRELEDLTVEVAIRNVDTAMLAAWFKAHSSRLYSPSA
jgi:death on curing protein